MRKPNDWLDLARKLDWDYSYVSEREIFPEAMSGHPYLPHAAWQGWDEPDRVAFQDCVAAQHEHNASINAVSEAVGKVEDWEQVDRTRLSALKLRGATLPLAEFAAVVGNLRAARFGRDSAWRSSALLAALEQCRHAAIPLTVLHDLVRSDLQFDFTHKLFHTNGWVAIAGRHLFDELLLGANPIEFAIATNFMFESGFDTLQLLGLSSVAQSGNDRMFEKMLQSIQSHDARHTRSGGPVLLKVMEHDPEYGQYLVDKWFWRCWSFFSLVTGFSMDYLTPLAERKQSFREFVDERVMEPFQRLTREYGLLRPWYWEQFVESVGYYHHMVYVSAYTYRASVWFDMALPSPEERAWLAHEYPASFPEIDPLWERISERARQAPAGMEWFTHGVTPVGFCSLCQLMLCHGTPRVNRARVTDHGDRRHVFCSEPCAWIFQREAARYSRHESVVDRILSGEAPGNLVELLRNYFGLSEECWGKDVARGVYPFLGRSAC